MSFRILLTKQAQKDKNLIRKSSLSKKVMKLLETLRENPFAYPPEYEKLKGDLQGFYSRRINDQHRLVYFVEGDKVYIVSLWSHYENI